MASGCSEDVPDLDPRCDDPTFRDANPQLCKNFASLVLMPEYVLSEPGKVITFTAKLRQGGREMDVDKGVSFGVSDANVAVINDLGEATGYVAGIVTVSALWQGLSAYAQLEIVASCADRASNFAILIDNSRSMGQNFSNNVATKINFAKQTARGFADNVDFSKDKTSVWKFNDAAEQLYDGSDFGADIHATKTAIDGISLSTGKSDLAGALRAVMDSFPEGDGTKVIILFTDGEYTGADPKPLATEFKNSKGVLIICAIRAWGDIFTMLGEMASGGFLISANPYTEYDIPAILPGLKSFLCGGTCLPGPITAPHAQLNYTGFVKWDVTRGRVDLIGHSFWDIYPGNGLYVDLQGTWGEGFEVEPGEPEYGQITSKDEFSFVAGKQYRFTVDLPQYKVAFVAPGTDLDTLITPIKVTLAGRDPELLSPEFGVERALVAHSFTWVQAADYTGKIVIEMNDHDNSGRSLLPSNVGVEIDDVLLEDITDEESPIVLFSDDFDGENVVTITPTPSYYGCLAVPPTAQAADPIPLIRLTE